jgi:hypothetical protein
MELLSVIGDLSSFVKEDFIKGGFSKDLVLLLFQALLLAPVVNIYAEWLRVNRLRPYLWEVARSVDSIVATCFGVLIYTNNKDKYEAAKLEAESEVAHSFSDFMELFDNLKNVFHSATFALPRRSIILFPEIIKLMDDVGFVLSGVEHGWAMNEIVSGNIDKKTVLNLYNKSRMLVLDLCPNYRSKYRSIYGVDGFIIDIHDLKEVYEALENLKLKMRLWNPVTNEETPKQI